MSSKYELEFLSQPGLYLSDDALTKLIAEVRAVAATCFTEIPDYQVMRGTREELSDKVLALARREDGTLVGFCSMVLLEVDGVGTVLHLGLTCVRPGDRGARLTHLLTSKAVMNYLLRYRPIGHLWISNCACVLSSLGNVALYFDDVYPSPFSSTKPSATHYAIAEHINTHYRDKMYVLEEAKLEPETFVFRGSVKDTVFQKDSEDSRYHHRNKNLNKFYKKILAFNNGDEVLQIGRVSLLTGLRYQFRKRKHRQTILQLDPVME